MRGGLVALFRTCFVCHGLSVGESTAPLSRGASSAHREVCERHLGAAHTEGRLNYVCQYGRDEEFVSNGASRGEGLCVTACPRFSFIYRPHVPVGQGPLY